MKKSLIAVAVAGAFVSTAHAEVAPAQPEVSLYGILDVGVAQLTNAGNFSSFVTGAVPTGSANQARIGTVRGVMNGGESQSRWGIKGSEDLGGGSKAFFQLESAFSLGTGALATSGLAGGGGATNRAMIADTALNGQLFNRMAFVGISNTTWGALSLGRHYSLQLDIIGSVGGGYDPVNAQMFSPINFSGAYGGGGATDNSRVDNSVKYANKFGDINVNALYGFGGVAGASSARTNAQLNVGYEGDVVGVQAAAQRANDTTSLSANAAPNTVNAQFVNLTSYMVALRFKVADTFAIKAGYERENITTPTNYATDALMTQIYSYNIGNNTQFLGAQKSINVYWLGANWQATDATKVSVGAYDAKYPSGNGVGNNTVTTSSANDRYFSAMVEYNMSKKTNLYAAAMKNRKTGALVALTGPGSITDFNTSGVGLRMKF